jgi:hypothetical protein
MRRGVKHSVSKKVNIVIESTTNEETKGDRNAGEPQHK